MTLYLNSNSNAITWTKKEYLLQAAKDLQLDIQPLTSGITPLHCLNIEPYDFVKGTEWTGIWEIDLLCDRGNTGPDWPYANEVFIAGSHIPSRLDRSKCTLLFQAINSHFYTTEIEQQYDFVISGSGGGGIYQKRSDAYTKLKEKFTFHDFGNNMPPQEYINVLKTARVQFIQSMSTHIWDGEIAQRFFECLGIGPVLTNYVDDLELTGLVEGEDYLAYRSSDEMMDKMERLIKDTEYAHRIAQNGRLKAFAYHTYSHRLLQIIQSIYVHK